MERFQLSPVDDVFKNLNKESSICPSPDGSSDE